MRAISELPHSPRLAEEQVTVCVKSNKANRITLIRTMAMAGTAIPTDTITASTAIPTADLGTPTTFEGQAYVAW